MDHVILNELITHQTPNFISRNGIPCVNTEFSAGQYVLLCELTCSPVGHEKFSLNRKNSGSICIQYIHWRYQYTKFSLGSRSLQGLRCTVVLYE